MKGLKYVERTLNGSKIGNKTKIAIAQNIEITPDNLSGIALKIA
jgi:hypothetical protein